MVQALLAFDTPQNTKPQLQTLLNDFFIDLAAGFPNANSSYRQNAIRNPKHISNFIDANLGADQIKAWQKLHGSNFEWNIEYIRTLSYKAYYNGVLKVNMTTCFVDVQPNNITITSNTLKSNVQIITGTHTIKAKGGIGLSGNRNDMLNVVPLITNAKYVTTDTQGADYVTYLTDEYGRVRNIKLTSLRSTPGGRRDGSQSSAACLANGIKDGRGCYNSGSKANLDQGGHMIAARFDGPVEQINYFAQDAEQNGGGGDWNNMENEWYATLPKPNAIPPVAGQTVSVEITPVFQQNSTNKRPERFEVTFKYNGIAQPQKPISNL